MSRVINLVFIQVFDQIGIIHPNGRELPNLLLFFSQRSRDILRADGQFIHRALGHELFKLAVRNRLQFGRKKVLLQVGNEKEGNQEIPDAEMGLRGQAGLLFLRVARTEQGTNLLL
jgi:hypothetical protein